MLTPTRSAAAALQLGRPTPKFTFMFDLPARWPGALHWMYNQDNAPVPYSANTQAAIRQIVAASKKWTAVCGVQIVYDGETATAPRTLIAGAPDGENVVGWQIPDIGISAATYSWYQAFGANDRTLVDSDIVMDPAYITTSAQMAQSMSREWGHAIGLANSVIPVRESACIVYASAAFGAA